MQQNVCVFENIGELLTLAGAEQKRARRIVESDLSVVADATLVSVDGRVAWSGPRKSFSQNVFSELGVKNPTDVVNVGGKTVLPGFVECHTHTVFAGDRSHEFEWRVQGQTYQEISAKGGGILSTVRETREASEAALKALAQPRVDRFVRQGVTCLEIKSGYGLDLETELKCLRVAGQLFGPAIVRTYLGAHSRSPDHPDLSSYMNQMLTEVLPRVAREKLAERADIYIEKGFYDLNLARQYFEKVRDLGLQVTAHCEQLSLFGGTDLALNYNPQSVDHVVYINRQTIQRIAQSSAVAVLLPASDFYLKMCYPPARELLDAGACVAVSTDFNPGTSPTQDLNFVGVLSRLEMKMTLAEVICAFTLGSAYALGKAQEVGSLSRGKSCDFTILNGSWRELFYSVGHHPVEQVYRAGRSLKK